MNDNISVGVFVFVAALFQVTLVASIDIAGGAADVLLLSLVAIALVRGAVTGAVAGFFGGLLIDVMTLDTLGFAALLYALAGYWTGRYGETTRRCWQSRSSRSRSPAPASAFTSSSARTCPRGGRCSMLFCPGLPSTCSSVARSGR